jgi:hypothetical protein
MNKGSKLLIFVVVVILSVVSFGCAGSSVYVSGGVGYGGYYGPSPWGGYGGYGGYYPGGGVVVVGRPPVLY